MSSSRPAKQLVNDLSSSLHAEGSRSSWRVFLEDDDAAAAAAAAAGEPEDDFANLPFFFLPLPPLATGVDILKDNVF